MDKNKVPDEKIAAWNAADHYVEELIIRAGAVLDATGGAYEQWMDALEDFYSLAAFTMKDEESKQFDDEFDRIVNLPQKDRNQEMKKMFMALGKYLYRNDLLMPRQDKKDLSRAIFETR
jgi:hypothetical protein